MNQSQFQGDRENEPLGTLAGQYLKALLDCDRERARELILGAVATGTTVRDIYLHVFQAAQYEVGRLWEANVITVAQEHYCTAVTQSVIAELYPRLFWSNRCGKRLVAACVEGEMHEMGVRMVCDFFEMEGWDTYYLGANTPTADMLKMVEDRKADVLAISATMRSHVPAVEELVRAVRSSATLARVPILVGGRSFNMTADLWKLVGADGTARDAAECVPMAVQLLGKKVVS